MTIDDVKELRQQEAAKFDALEAIVKLLDALRDTQDDDAVEWVLEKLNE